MEVLVSRNLVAKIYHTTYDALGRIEKRSWDDTEALVTTYNYQEGTEGSSSTQVATIANGTEVIHYTYDANGNITSIQSGELTIHYTYDTLDQLVREDHSGLNATIVYVYDLGGNLLEKCTYPYQPDVTDEALAALEPTDTVLYTYDSTWKDQLVSYDGELITYDAIGNPLMYRGMTFDWDHTRELGSITKDGHVYGYRYDQDGIRNRKYLEDGTVTYQIESDRIVGEWKYAESGSALEYVMEYLYDSFGNLISLVYNGVEYYYVKNLQGDIIGILDGNGTKVVTYEYDSWGKLLELGGSNETLGQLNPFRYRGYYYDSETGFYYVSSRYYDPEVGRFISPDTTDILGVSSDLYDKNLYAYCDNNPVIRMDINGDCWGMILSVGTSVISSFLSAKITGQEYTIYDFSVAVVSGFFGGISSLECVGAMVGGLINCGYTMLMTTLNGASATGAIVAGISSGVTSGLTFSVMSKLAGTKISEAAGTFADLVFGFGMGLVSTVVSIYVAKETRNVKKPSSPKKQNSTYHRGYPTTRDKYFAGPYTYQIVGDINY